MVDNPTEEGAVIDLGPNAKPEDIARLHRRIERWAGRVEPIEGGTVQKTRWPDAWAYVLGLAWVAIGVTFALIWIRGDVVAVAIAASSALLLAIAGVLADRGS